MRDYDMREGLTPRRVTNAMWDYSWLVGHYPGGPFENFDKATDELLERGFNTVRIDCFPWFIANLKEPVPGHTVMFPANPLATWGFSTMEWKHDVLAELLEFLRLAKKKNIYVILSNWGYGCAEFTSKRDMSVQKAQALLVSGWKRILDLVRAENLSSSILLVDLDQEFPLFSHNYDTFTGIGSPGKNVKPGERWNNAQKALVSDYFTFMLTTFQHDYPEFRYTFSQHAFFEELRSLNLPLDVLEVHIWLGDARADPRNHNRTGFLDMIKDRAERDYSDYQSRVDRTLGAVKPMLFKAMENKIAFFADWAKTAAAPVITTEAWGPFWHGDQKDLKWDWLKDWCLDCVALAADYGFWGITPWNFSHPYWENWKDVAWYRKINGIFLA
jgi:hypothetical protein